MQLSPRLKRRWSCPDFWSPFYPLSQARSLERSNMFKCWYIHQAFSDRTDIQIYTDCISQALSFALRETYGNHSYTTKGWVLGRPACEIPPKEISLISSSLSARKTPHRQSVARRSLTSAFIYVLQLAPSLLCLQHWLVLRSPKKNKMCCPSGLSQ